MLFNTRTGILIGILLCTLLCAESKEVGLLEEISQPLENQAFNDRVKRSPQSRPSIGTQQTQACYNCQRCYRGCNRNGGTCC